MGFFKNQLGKQLENFKQSIPDERLDELEAQGYDVSEYRKAKQDVRDARNAAQEEMRNGHEKFVPISLSLNRI